jgi:hypothetical protein
MIVISQALRMPLYHTVPVSMQLACLHCAHTVLVMEHLLTCLNLRTWHYCWKYLLFRLSSWARAQLRLALRCLLSRLTSTAEMHSLILPIGIAWRSPFRSASFGCAADDEDAMYMLCCAQTTCSSR